MDAYNCSEGVNHSAIANCSRPTDHDFSMWAVIGIYSTIFILAVVGNGLVILTLVQNTRMRTVTNVFLLNLAISDLLLAVFCMPFTLIPIQIKNFIFGPVMCVSIRYAQGVSVGASCFTLVAISLERYFAICRPLHSRQWQTLSHAYKIIAICWAFALVIVIPIAISTKYVQFGPNRHACRENWQDKRLERAYTVFLDVILLIIPLCLMTGSYSKIMATLCAGIHRDDNEGLTMPSLVSMKNTNSQRGIIKNGNNFSTRLANKPGDKNYFSIQMNEISPCSSEESTPRRKLDQTRIIRQSNQEKSREAKLRVVRMLFVLVIEFFVCWTPLYTVQTWKSFHQESVRENLNNFMWSTMFVFSYLSSCCNPITYCFMNTRFRQAFLNALRRCLCCKTPDFTSYRMNTSTRRLTWIDAHKAEETELSYTDKPRNGTVTLIQ
ncbi:CCKAR-like protein [Mya arenaria]|uniref:Gastrin/cholecystokinin type B receptor n=1 Tax=Mya arenaria TaxID=6604 RepID=A0ABY7DT05_MYAAR|nr:cholecystokinin receptor-like [Mya arenaria]WAQ99490.1 CCKAR-like protein [Mya arenaria]